jgi:predicted Zn-dependent protease
VAGRDELLRQMAAEFPDSAMAHFSLGAFLLETKRYEDAVRSLERATQLQSDYAAAWVALGDAQAAAGAAQAARAAYAQGRMSALAQGHSGLAEEIDAKLAAIR